MKRITKILTFLLIIAVSIFFISCTERNNNENTLFQVSTLQALMMGGYEGTLTVDELLKQGDTGLGTFDGLDGEMIVYEGVVYKVKGNGKVIKAEREETIPFANVSFFNEDSSSNLSFNNGYSSLKSKLAQLHDFQNKPIMFKIDGDFNNIEYRSVYEQQKPYPELAQALENQSVFQKSSIQGTLVGLYMPSYYDNINASGYHLHFISDDKKAGGHLLNVQSGDINVSYQSIENFSMRLPDTLEDFDFADLEDMEEA